jgi:hypothetical protein
VYVKKTFPNFSRSRRSWDILQEVKESSSWFPCGTLNELHGHKWTIKPSMCALDAVKTIKKKIVPNFRMIVEVTKNFYRWWEVISSSSLSSDAGEFFLEMV